MTQFANLNFFGLHLNFGAKFVSYEENYDFFLNLGQNFHEIAAAFRLLLVKTAKASRHAIFYSLNPAYQQLIIFLNYSWRKVT